MGMFSFFASAPKVLDNVLDKDKGLFAQIGGFINELSLTPEEVMNQNAKTADSVQAYGIATMEENSERSKSRREIARMYIQFYLLWVSVGLGIWPINEDYAIFIITAMTGVFLGGAFVAIITFHFGSHGLAKLQKKK